MVGLVDDEDVGNLENAGLEQLHRVAAAGLKCDDCRVGEFGDFDLGLADADRLDDDDVQPERIHEGSRVAGRSGKPAQMPAAGHRTNEDVGVGEVLRQTNAVAQNRTVRERRARVDRDYADRFSFAARDANQRGTQGRLPDPGRTGQPDRRRAARA